MTCPGRVVVLKNTDCARRRVRGSGSVNGVLNRSPRVPAPLVTALRDRAALRYDGVRTAARPSRVGGGESSAQELPWLHDEREKGSGPEIALKGQRRCERAWRLCERLREDLLLP